MVGRRAILVAVTAVAVTVLSLTATGCGTQSSQAGVGAGYGPAAVLAGMSEQQRVGQLFMAGVPATGPVSSDTAAGASARASTGYGHLDRARQAPAWRRPGA